MEEIIDLDLNQDNVDFGSGAELLMNDKQKSTNKDISLDKELSELNEIEDVNIGKNTVKMDTQPSIPFKKNK